MAKTDRVTLLTGDPTYPQVTAYVSCWGYEKEVGDERGPSRDIIYHIYDDPEDEDNAEDLSDLFMDALLGLSAQTVTAGTIGVNYRPAHRYPYNERIVCRYARGRHKGTGRPAAKLHGTNFVEILAHYDVPPYPLGPEDDPGGISTFEGGPYPFVVTNIDRGFRTVPVPGTHKEGDEDAVLDSFQLRVPEIIMKFQYVSLPNLGGPIFNVLHGKVNEFTFMGFAPETLLFEAPRSENRISARGDRQSDVEFQMTWYLYGHNTEWFPGDSVPTRVLLPDGTPPNKLADFSVLTQYVP